MHDNVPCTLSKSPLLSRLTSAITATGETPNFHQEHYPVWNLLIRVFKMSPDKHNMTGSNVGLLKTLHFMK
jgi:hypothetical protein